MSDLVRTLEALIFLAPSPVLLEDLATAAEASLKDTKEALAQLGQEFSGQRGIVLREVAGGFTFATHPGTDAAVKRLFAKPRTPPLSAAQAETLAIVAYLQPVSRPEIARIRGVSAESAVATLVERGVIEESGRSQFGASLYKTTELFEKVFGLNGLSELPDPTQFDPTPEDERQLRERLLKVGEQRIATTEQVTASAVDSEP